MNIESKISKMLSDGDLREYLGDSLKIVKYADLDNYNTIFDLLPNKIDYAIILLETQRNEGHWLAITRRGNEFVIFDSYGKSMLYNLNCVSATMNKILGQTADDFSNLFKNIKNIKITSNKKKYQILEENINACGRYSILYIRHHVTGGNLKDFHEFIERNRRSTGLTYDEIVSYYT